MNVYALTDPGAEGTPPAPLVSENSSVSDNVSENSSVPDASSAATSVANFKPPPPPPPHPCFTG